MFIFQNPALRCKRMTNTEKEGKNILIVSSKSKVFSCKSKIPILTKTHHPKDYLIERLDPGPRDERRSGFVESDVAVGSDASNEEFDSAGLGNLLFVIETLDLQVRRVSVEDVHVVGVNVNVLKKVLRKKY